MFEKEYCTGMEDREMGSRIKEREERRRGVRKGGKRCNRRNCEMACRRWKEGVTNRK